MGSGLSISGPHTSLPSGVDRMVHSRLALKQMQIQAPNKLSGHKINQAVGDDGGPR